MGQFWTAIITLVCAVVGSTTAILLALWKTYIETKKASAQAGEANDAINHRHTGSPRAFDMLAKLYEDNGGHEVLLGELIDWQRSFKGSPWESGPALEQWRKKQDEEYKEHCRVHARIEDRLKECFPDC